MRTRIWKRIVSLTLALGIVLSLSVNAFAEEASASADVQGYVVLGQDLTTDQQSTVLNLLGVTDLSQYSLSYTTHQEEEDYFGQYLSASVLGSRALSSILLVPGEEGSGISITLKNINFCTEEMYQSALVDAGVKDVQLVVAGPVSLSGTCALASAMKAYSLMTGEEIDQAAADAAVNEIATTVAVAEEIASAAEETTGDTDTSADDATSLIAALKQQVLSSDLSEDEIGTALDNLCETLGVTLTDATRQEIIDLMLKLKNTDIDVNQLQEQASALYDKISEKFDLSGVDKATVLQSIQNFFVQIIRTISNLFQSAKSGSTN